MLKVDTKFDRFYRGLETFRSRFHPAMEKAVLDSARIGVSRIIAEFDKEAPPPTVKYYIRTDELVSGWKPAAERLGIAAKSAKPTAQNPESGYGFLNSSPDMKEFLAGNTSAHAYFVEFYGTWKTPYPSRRPSYLRASITMQTLRERDTLRTLAGGEWRRLLV